MIIEERGVIQTINTDRGYAFIRPSGEFKAIFVHAKQFKPGAFDTLAVGDAVQFVRGSDRAGRPCAMSCEVVQ